MLQDGRLLEKAAASVSIIHGVLTPERARAMSGRGREGVDAAGGQTYSAAALSLVFHSRRCAALKHLHYCCNAVLQHCQHSF